MYLKNTDCRQRDTLNSHYSGSLDPGRRVQYGCSQWSETDIPVASRLHMTCERCKYSNLLIQTFGGSVSTLCVTQRELDTQVLCCLVINTALHLLTAKDSASVTVMRVEQCQTKVCTGVMERVGEPARSEEEEAERLVTSRCNSSTLFCSSARLANSSL